MSEQPTVPDGDIDDELGLDPDLPEDFDPDALDSDDEEEVK